MTLEELRAYLKDGIERLEKPAWLDYAGEQFKQIITHTRGVFPKWLDMQFPNEDGANKKWRKANWEPVTMDIVHRFIMLLSRAVSTSNYSYDGSGAFLKKIKEYKIQSTDLPGWINKTGIRRRIEDPNALIVPLPAGAIGDRTKAIDLTFEIVPSANIVCIDKEFICFKSSQKSNVSVPKKGAANTQQAYETKEQGDVYFFLTDNDYFVHYQVGIASERKYVTDLFYNHNIGKKPFVTLGGIPSCFVDKNECDHDVFLSDIFPFTAHGNEALRDKNIHICVKNTVGFPDRVIEVVDCINNVCQSGRILDPKSGSYSTCGTCHGKGHMPVAGPLDGWVVMKQKTGLDKSDKESMPIRRLDVNPVNLTTMGGEYDKTYAKAEAALQLRLIEMAQSGVAKEMDREDQYSSIYTFADYWFDCVLSPLLNFANELWFVGTTEKVQVQKPVSFKIKNEVDLQAEWMTYTDKGITTGLASDAYSNLIQRRFSGDEIAQKAEYIATAYDPLYLYTQPQREQMLGFNLTDSRSVGISLRMATQVRKIAYLWGREKFLKADEATIFAELDKYFLKVLPMPVIAEGTDAASAEAQNKIKGSVGGVSAITAIMQSVGLGQITPEQAIASLTTIFGFTEQEAEEIAGEGKLETSEPAPSFNRF